MMKLTVFLLHVLVLWALTSFAETVERIEPAENLVVQGIPAISSELAHQVIRYQNIRSARFFSWLPGQAGLLIATRFAQTDQVHWVSGPGGRRTQLTFFPERIAWARHCPRKGCRLFLFGMDVGGSEAYQIFRYDFKTGEHTRLTDGKSRNTRAVWNRVGDRVAFSSTRRNGRDFDIYLMNPSKLGSAKLLLEVSGHWQALDFSPDGRTLLVRHYVSINESHLHLVDVDTGQRTSLTPADEHGVSYPSAVFSANGRRIFLTTDRHSQFVRLGWVKAKAHEFRLTFLTPSLKWNVEKFARSADGQLIAFVTNQGGFSKLHLISTSTGKRFKPPEILPGVVRNLEFQPDGHLLAIGMMGSRLPGDVFSYDPKRRRLERWTYSETGGLGESAFVDPEMVSYPTFDREGKEPRQIPAFLYLPPKRFKPPHPVLISIHGGPEGQARPYFLGQTNYQISQMGIALIRPNVRGSAGYGKKYLLLDNGKLREDSVRDIGALLDWIETRTDLDSGRVAVSGGSYGGYMSLASLTKYSHRLRCGIDYVGISNFVTFLENTKPYRRDLRRAEYGDERDADMRAFLNKISPLNHVDKIRVPLLVIQGANDPRVPASESEQIVKKVKNQGGKVWYLLAKDEGHGFVKKANLDYAQLTAIRFLHEHLLGPKM